MLSNGYINCEYDSANRLLKADGHTYTYNAEDVRIHNLCGDADTTYTYNTNCKLSQLLTKTTNGITTKYVYGNGLIGEEKEGCFKTYHFDFRGSTVAITDVNGNIIDTFKYDTYGNVTEHIGNSFVIFGYNGRDGVVTDKNGLIYMRARYYSPAMRRFINADILHGQISDSTSLNRYSYVNGNPVSFVDPFGLSKERGMVDFAKVAKEIEYRRLMKQIQEFQRKQESLRQLSGMLKIILDNLTFESNVEASVDLGYGFTLSYSVTQSLGDGYSKVELINIANGQKEHLSKFALTNGKSESGVSANGFYTEYSAEINDKTSLSASVMIGKLGSVGAGFSITSTVDKYNEITTSLTLTKDPFDFTSLNEQMEKAQTVALAVGAAAFVLGLTFAEDVATKGVGIYNDMPAINAFCDSLQQLVNYYDYLATQTQIQQNVSQLASVY